MTDFPVFFNFLDELASYSVENKRKSAGNTSLYVASFSFIMHCIDRSGVPV